MHLEKKNTKWFLFFRILHTVQTFKLVLVLVDVITRTCRMHLTVVNSLSKKCNY